MCCESTKIQFYQSFFGVNGITKKQGFTTHDINEANIKSVAMSKCKNNYILADSTKFLQNLLCIVRQYKLSKIITTKKIHQNIEFRK